MRPRPGARRKRPPRSSSRPSRRPPAPPGSADWLSPWVQLRSAAYHPYIYERMVRVASDEARPGDLVAVYDKNGALFGSAFYNPKSKITLRMISFGEREVGLEYFRELIARAVALRHETLRLEETEAYRLFSSEGDGLSGLSVDRFGDVLSVEVSSFGVYTRLGALVPMFHELCGTSHHHIRVDPQIAHLEGFTPRPTDSGHDPDVPASVRIVENGVRFAVDFARGHKTGFFCDQRDNRRDFASLVRGRSVLDLCCYTGGFAIYARVLGETSSVTGVDLDEVAIDQARHNANLNQTRIRWVQADAFSYARQMRENGTQFEALVLDPPKFIPSRSAVDEGRKKYFDLNRLALSLLSPGGLFVTCSCSGLMDARDFERLVIAAAHAQRKRLQLLRTTGAGADHPVMSNCPEGKYLKVLWWRAE